MSTLLRRRMMMNNGDNVDWKSLAIELVERNGGILSIPNGVTKVGKEAFRFAPYSELIFPDSVVSIDTNSCASSSTLKRVTIGNGCTALNDSCFLGDYNLEYVSLGESVSFIHSKAFQNCNALKTFICRAATPPTLTSLPANIITIYVPDTSVDAYKAASGWSAYAEKIKPLSYSTQLLFHFDGNYTDERGHTFERNNTYYDGTYADGVFGQCPWNESGGFNFQIHDVFTHKPNKFTFSFWCYDDNSVNTDVVIGLCRPTGSTSWSSFYKTSGLCIYCLPRNKQLRVCPNGDYDSLRQGTATQTAPSNQWAHYAVTYDNGLISWYCNGNRVGQMQIDHENDFVYKGNDFGLHNWNKCDEIMFADDLLIEGETYTVPTKPYK